MTEYAPPAWRVESQIPRTRANLSGTVEEGYDVTFVTRDGHTGTVFVPNARYNVDNVRAVVAEAAARVDAVGALTAEE
jgi:hypothetical protein